MSILGLYEHDPISTEGPGNRFLGNYGLTALVAGAALALGAAQPAQAQAAPNSAAYQQAFSTSSANFTQPMPMRNADPQIATVLAHANATLEGVKQAYLQGDDATKGAIDGMLAKAGPIVQQSAARIMGDHNQTLQPTNPTLSPIEKMQAQIDQAGAVAVPPEEYAQAKQGARPNILHTAGGGAVAGAGVGMVAGIFTHSIAAKAVLAIGGAAVGAKMGSDAGKADEAKQQGAPTGRQSHDAQVTNIMDRNPAWYISDSARQIASVVPASSNTASPQLRSHAAEAANNNSSGGGSGGSASSLVSAAGGRNQQVASGPAGLPD